MRHRLHGYRLGRDAAHRRALRENLVADLICYEKVVTTEAKARMLRPLPRFRSTEDGEGDAEKIDVVQRLFNDVAPRYMERPGGYTRMIKLGQRNGDNAYMAVVMLVGDDDRK